MLPLKALVRLTGTLMDLQEFVGVLKDFLCSNKGLVRSKDSSIDFHGFDDVFKDVVRPLKIF